MSDDAEHKKPGPSGQKVSPGQMALLPEEAGYDICMLADPRHEVFCREYAATRNGTRSYMVAFPGVRENSAATNAWELLRKTEIQQRVAQISADRMQRLEITHERLLQETAKLAFLDPRAFYRQDGSLIPIPELDPDVAAALEGAKIKTVEIEGDAEKGEPNRLVSVAEIKYGSKRAALELLMRNLEMIRDVVDVQHSGVVATTDDLEKLDRLRERFGKGGRHGAAQPS